MSQELTSEQIQQALQGISVPAQPQIMVDLQMEQYMPDPDLEVIAKLISQDPGLSGALLKIVNSPYYGLTNKIASIQRAVNLLGSRSIINLINAQSIKGEMNDETIVTLNRFWDTAQDVAMTCLTLAKRIGTQAGDEAYALGLFHDCGVPLMLQRFPDYMTVLEQAYANAGPNAGWWTPKIGVQHQPRGGRLLHGQVLAPAGACQQCHRQSPQCAGDLQR
jgi:HD-like signal output (HDOD) protein